MRDEASFRAFVEANGATLLHAARLLTGDHHRGEDLVQTALTRLYLKWDRVDAPLAYAEPARVRIRRPFLKRLRYVRFLFYSSRLMGR